jgi:hypothetical protein
MIATNDDLLTRLDTMSSAQDPLADRTVEDLVAKRGLDYASKLFDACKRAYCVPKDVADEVGDYLNASSVLPPWYDREKALRGQQIYCDYGPECMVVLLCKSLPSGYIQWHVAETLYATGRMTESDKTLRSLTRRILETLQFLINVMTPGSLEKDGIAIRTTQNIRLIHAAIRHFISRSKRWSPDWANPINQQELLMTMLTFSLLVVDGLRQMGFRMRRKDQEAVLHLWMVVGWILGIQDENMPRDMGEARTMWETIAGRSYGKTPAGEELTRALIDYQKSIVPFRFLRFVPALFVRYMNGHQVSRDLGVQPLFYPVELLLIGLLRFIFRVLQSIEFIAPFVRRGLRIYHQKMLQKLLLYWNDEKQVHFHIPESLRGNWGL